MGKSRVQHTFARGLSTDSISIDAVFYGLYQEAIEMSCSETNFCKKEKMSICSAEDSKQQEKCSFFEKSSYEHRCMYFIFDEYCDCLKAQIQTKR
jgi:hypothetical protein